jgi:hypothetical protein
LEKPIPNAHLHGYEPPVGAPYPVGGNRTLFLVGIEFLTQEECDAFIEAMKDEEEQPMQTMFAGRPLKITTEVDLGFLHVHPETLHVWGMLPTGVRTVDGKYVILKDHS